MDRDLDHQRVVVGVEEGQPARERLVEDDAEPVDVGAAVELEAAARLLRAHVRGRAAHHAGAGDGGGRAGAGDLGDAEVEELGDHLAAGEAVEEDVARLDVAVDDPLVVRQREGAGHVADRRQHVERPEGAGALEDGVERVAREQLHHQEGRAVLGVADVEHVDDARVADAPADAGLGEEALDGGGILGGDAGSHHLDGDLAAEGVVDRSPDDSHPALPEEADQPVSAPDHVSRGKHGSGANSTAERTGGQGRPAAEAQSVMIGEPPEPPSPRALTPRAWARRPGPRGPGRPRGGRG